MGFARRESVEFPDFEEFIASLNAHRVRYLIVGAYAVGFHARPRATKDIDILVDRTAANARRVRAALVSFLGSPAPNITQAKLENPRTLIVLGVSPVRIDILTSIDGVASFTGAWQRRCEGRYGSTLAYFLSLEDLITAKAASGRPQDLADLDALERAERRRRPRVTRQRAKARSSK
jgi:predicted nucleotidyltransferase